VVSWRRKVAGRVTTNRLLVAILKWDKDLARAGRGIFVWEGWPEEAKRANYEDSALLSWVVNIMAVPAAKKSISSLLDCVKLFDCVLASV
jgi:hypothetical protein